MDISKYLDRIPKNIGQLGPTGDLSNPLYLRYVVKIDGHELGINPDQITTSLHIKAGQIVSNTTRDKNGMYSRSLNEPSEEISFTVRLPRWSWGKIFSVSESQNVLGTVGLGTTFSDVANNTKILPNVKPYAGPRLPTIGADLDWIRELKIKAVNHDPVKIIIQRNQGLAIPKPPLEFNVKSIARNALIDSVSFQSTSEREYVITDISIKEDAKDSFWASVQFKASEYKPHKRFSGKLVPFALNNPLQTADVQGIIGASIKYDEAYDFSMPKQTTVLAISTSPYVSGLISFGMGAYKGLKSFGSTISGLFRTAAPVTEAPLLGSVDLKDIQTLRSERVIGINFDPAIYTEQVGYIPPEHVTLPKGTILPVGEME